MLKHAETDETAPAIPGRALVGPVPGGETAPAVPPASADFKSLGQQLVSRTASVRTEAERQLSSMDVSTLLALMAEERRLRKRRRVWLSVVVGMSLLILPCLAYWLHTPGVFMSWWGVMMAIIVGSVTFTQTHKSGALALARMDDLKAMGELIGALEIRDATVQRAVRPALTRLLPRLRADNSSLLSTTDRRLLRLFMEGRLPGGGFLRGRNTEGETLLVLAALQALEQVGDATFVPIVSEWAIGHKRGSDGRIRQAAERCLPFLVQSSMNRKIGMEMLRASAPDQSHDAEVLLRPAADTEDASAENLLRPSRPD